MDSRLKVKVGEIKNVGLCLGFHATAAKKAKELEDALLKASGNDFYIVDAKTAESMIF